MLFLPLPPTAHPISYLFHLNPLAQESADKTEAFPMALRAPWTLVATISTYIQGGLAKQVI